METTEKDKIALELKIIAGDLKYATELQVEDFQTFADELYDMGASIQEWVNKQ